MRIILYSVLLTSTFVASATAIYAQSGTDKLKVKVRLNPEAAVNDKRVPTSIFPVGTSSVMIVRNKEAGGGIQSFSKVAPSLELYDRAKLNKIRDRQPLLKVSAGELFLEDVVWFDGKPLLIAARRDTVQGIVELYWQFNDANLTGTPLPFERLCAFDAKVWGTGVKMSSGTAFRDAFSTSLSPDGKKLLIHSADVVDNDGDIRRLMVAVGPGMKILWQQTLEVEDTRNLSVLMDNAGDAIALVKRTFQPKDLRKDTTSFSLHLHRIDDEGVSEIDMAIGKDRMPKSALLKAMPDGRVLLTALLEGADAKGARTNTHFLGHLAEGAAQVKPLATLAFKHNSDDASYTKEGMRPTDILQRKDGGYFLIREYFLETSAPDTKLAMSGLRWIQGPIVVSSIDAKGAELWTNTFRRLHYNSDRVVGDALALVYDEKLLLFMIDSDEMAAKRKAGDTKLTPADSKQVYSVYVTMDEDPKPRSKAVLRSGGANDYILGSNIWKLAENEYLVLGSSKLGGSRLQPVKIELGE